MKNLPLLRNLFFLAFLVASCTDHDIFQEPTQFKSEEVAADLLVPLALTHDASNNLWVTEQGTGSGKSGRVSVITPDGKIYPGITGFLSVISPENAPSGLTHLSYKDGKLYILHGPEGKLYIADISKFKPGTDSPIDAGTLPSEDIGSIVKASKFKHPTNESNLYNMTWGPDGDLYITDAAANAIVHRAADKSISIFAEFDPYYTATDTIDFVPTGIVYDGSKFLVTSLSGGPFIKGLATIKQVNTSGVIKPYKEGFTTLVDIELTPGNKPLVVSFAEFSFATTPPNFAPFTGQIQGDDKTTISGGLMMPTDLERTGDKTYFYVSLALAKVFKLTY
jgi:hypothetical protein